MRPRRIFPPLVSPLLLTLLSGCGYVHLGRLPEAAPATVIGDAQLTKENTDLKLEKKMLQQELALTRAQGDALRMAIENRAADGDTSKRLADKLTETSRELATLRASYAKLQAEKDQAVASAAESGTLRARLGDTEEKLAASLRTFTELQGEIGRLRSEVDRTRAENVALSEQVRTVTAQNAEAQAALAQLNTDLLAQKDARVRAEQDAQTLRTQIQSAPNASALAQQRTGSAADARSLATEHAAEIAALKQELDTSRAKLTTLESERTQLKQQLAQAAPPPELANVEAKLASALRTTADLRSENDQLKTASVQLSATKLELETQLAQLRNAPGAAQAQALREQLQQAQAQASALTEENARLKSRIATVRPTITLATPPPVNDGPPRIELASNSEPRAAGASRPTLNAESPDAAGGGAPVQAAPVNRTSSVTATLVTSGAGRPAGAARTEAPGQGRFHIVASGDTLSKISALYYGTPTRWGDILAANRDILGENNNLVIGRTLRIP